MKDAELFWNNVKPLIKANKTTQAKLAEVCQIPFGTLQGWIAKDVLPDVISAYKISSILNTSVEYLVTGKESNAFRLKYQTLVESLRKLTEESEKVLS